MTDPNLDRYTVKEILTEFVVPELREKADRVDVEALERDVRQLQAKILTPESVANMIGVALERKEARGWTTKERAMGVIVLLFTGIGAAFALLQIVVLLSG
jgi:hypothetical protein